MTGWFLETLTIDFEFDHSLTDQPTVSMYVTPLDTAGIICEAQFLPSNLPSSSNVCCYKICEPWHLSHL